MKNLSIFSLVLCIIFSFSFLSCGTSKKSKSEKKGTDSEISSVEIEGGEMLHLYGYSKDSEVVRKMKLLDIDFVDCYQNTVEKGKAESISIDFDLEIDNDGFFENIEIVKVPSKEANKIAKCVKKEVESIGVRPGNPRNAKYTLSYKIIKERPKKMSKQAKAKAAKDDLRSKTLASLAQMKKFNDCYEARKAKNPKLQGKFTLKFTVSEDGEVYDIKLRNNTFTDKYVVNCVVEKLEDTVFPQGDSEDEVEVNFNFTATYNNPRPDKPRKSLSL